MSPAGLAWRSADVRLDVIRARWCCFATEVWASREKSMKVPITAKTLSSSVSFVQTERGPAVPIGQYESYTGTSLRPTTPFALMSSMNDWYTWFWFSRIESVKLLMHVKSTRAIPIFTSVGVTPTPGAVDPLPLAVVEDAELLLPGPPYAANSPARSAVAMDARTIRTRLRCSRRPITPPSTYLIARITIRPQKDK